MIILSSKSRCHLAPFVGVLHGQGGHDLLDLLPHAGVAGVGTNALDDVRGHTWIINKKEINQFVEYSSFFS